MIIEELSLDEYISLLSGVHKQILRIALEIKRICEKNDIKFFLIAGSLLGAVRHHGFIPWDDDMDIAFLRDDYQRFIAACSKDLSNDFFLVTTDDPVYGLPFSKIMLKNTIFLEKGAPAYSNGNCIYVDIFPLDCFPDGNFQRKIHSLLINITRYALLDKCKYPAEKTKKTLKQRLASTYSKLLSKKDILKRLDRVSRKFNGNSTQFYYNSGTAYPYGKELYPVSCFDGELPQLEFEGHLFPCPKEYEKLLTILYGDYMVFPPEDKRYNRHGVLEISFDSQFNSQSNSN